MTARVQPPLPQGGDWDHRIGADTIGRDMLRRLTYALRTSILIAIVDTAIGAAPGTLIGAHRRDSAHWPENSHAADVLRLCGDPRRIADLTPAEAQALRPAHCSDTEIAGQVSPRALLPLDVKLTASAGRR